MGTGVSMIVKGRILRLIDQRLANPTKALLEELESGEEGLGEIALRLGYIEEGAGTNHVDVEALGDEGEQGAWWPSDSHKEEMLRGAYIQALRLATQYTPPKPVVTYWIREGPRFETMVADSASEVHVFWLTPEAPPPSPPPPGNEFPEDLWVIATPNRIEEIRGDLNPDYDVEDPFELPNAEGVACFRLYGYHHS